MDLYISSHDRAPAEDAARVLRDAGHTITSTWHADARICSNPIPDDEQAKRAESNFREIRQADALVLISGNDRYPGGKFVEAGYALGWGHYVVVVGVRENMLLHGLDTRLAATVEDVDAELAQLSC